MEDAFLCGSTRPMLYISYLAELLVLTLLSVSSFLCLLLANGDESLDKASYELFSFSIGSTILSKGGSSIACA